MYYFLRYLEIVKTGGDTRDVCMSRDAGEPEKAFMVPRENNDIIGDEDEDVARERQRVKDIQTNPPPKVKHDWGILKKSSNCNTQKSIKTFLIY